MQSISLWPHRSWTLPCDNALGLGDSAFAISLLLKDSLFFISCMSVCLHQIPPDLELQVVVD